MAVHIFDAEDSDGDSWLEVVEGSPGPSMQNSRASLIYTAEAKVDSTRRVASWIADDTWVSEFEDYKVIKGGQGTEEFANKSSVDSKSLPPHDSTQDKPRPITNPLRTPNTAHPQLDQKLRLDCPEVGDIIHHFNEVQTLATAQPRKGLYYRLWLCWMYRMDWPQIEHTAQHAPDYILQVVNHWFGLRNHPFWTASDKCPYQWYAMYGACLDIWKWWDQQNTDIGDDSDRTITQESFRNSAIDSKTRAYVKPLKNPVENQYSTFYGRIVGRDDIQPDASTTIQLHEYTSTTPWQVSDRLSFVVRTYKSLGSPRSDPVGQGPIPFQTWIHWIHQVNLQPSSKQWAGHDLWPSSSPSASPLSPHLLSFQAVALKHIGDVAYEYVKDIGLPYKAAAYYQSVSYI